jgi:Zn-finger nucleic acid-binding protein
VKPWECKVRLHGSNLSSLNVTMPKPHEIDCPACKRKLLHAEDSSVEECRCPACGVVFTWRRPIETQIATKPAVIVAPSVQEPDAEVSQQPVPLPRFKPTELQPPAAEGQFQSWLRSVNPRIAPWFVVGALYGAMPSLFRQLGLCDADYGELAHGMLLNPIVWAAVAGWFGEPMKRPWPPRPARRQARFALFAMAVMHACYWLNQYLEQRPCSHFATIFLTFSFAAGLFVLIRLTLRFARAIRSLVFGDETKARPGGTQLTDTRPTPHDSDE